MSAIDIKLIPKVPYLLLLLGYVCFGCNGNWENILHHKKCLVWAENLVNLKFDIFDRKISGPKG